MDDRDNDSTDALRVYLLGSGERKEHEKKLRPGMLTYLDDGTVLDPQIVSLHNTKNKKADENDVAEAIRTISSYTGIPVGEIVRAINRLSMEYGLQHMERNTECILTNDMVERLKVCISNPEKVFVSNKPIAVGPCSDEIFIEKEIYLDSNTYGGKSYTATIEIPYTTEFERFKQNIVDSQIIIVRNDYYSQERYQSQHEVANRNRHTSNHVPFYFKIFGQSRFVPRKSGRKGHTKFNRNVRPKGTHSHFKFYR